MKIIIVFLMTISLSLFAHANKYYTDIPMNDPDEFSIRYAAPISDWKTPDYSEKEATEILAGYDYLDPKKIVPSAALKNAVLYFHKNSHLITNKNYLSLINFKAHSGQKRFFFVNMKTGNVEAAHVAHGQKSDVDHDGFATTFSNVNNSNKSSLGFYMAAEYYYSDKVRAAVRLDGLSTTNSLARARGVVLHGASYVSPNLKKMGRSLGCPAIDNAILDRIIKQLKDGSLIYAFY